MVGWLDFRLLVGLTLGSIDQFNQSTCIGTVGTVYLGSFPIYCQPDRVLQKYLVNEKKEYKRGLVQLGW